MAMKALQGATRTALLGFFGSHIIFTLIIDAQALLPPSFFPAFLQDFLAWYAATLKDPLMSNPRELLWFQSLIACEMAFQLPFFFAAVFMIGSSSRTIYPDWFRSACIAYGAHTATTMAPILATLATNEKATVMERAVILSVYLPYLIFPLWILFIAAKSSTETTKTKAN